MQGSGYSPSLSFFLRLPSLCRRRHWLPWSLYPSLSFWAPLSSSWAVSSWSVLVVVAGPRVCTHIPRRGEGRGLRWMRVCCAGYRARMNGYSGSSSRGSCSSSPSPQRSCSSSPQWVVSTGWGGTEGLLTIVVDMVRLGVGVRWGCSRGGGAGADVAGGEGHAARFPGQEVSSLWPGRTYSPLLASCVAAR